MKKIVILLGLSIASVLFGQDNNFSYIDVITLKDGSIIKGIIIENKFKQSIKVEVGPNTFSYKYDEIKILTKEKILKQSNQQFQNSGENNDNLEIFSPLIIAEMDRLEDEKGSPGLSFFLSFLWGGGGQFYNGEVTAGIVHSLVAGVGWGMVIGGLVVNARNKSDRIAARNSFMVAAIGLGTLTINGIWSMVDAPITTMAKNREINQKIRDLRVSKQSSPEESVKFAIGPSFGKKSINGVFLGLSYGY